MQMQSHIGCICLIFLHCAFSNVSSMNLDQSMHNHIGCICLIFLHCAFSNVSSKRLHKKMQSHIGSICLTFLYCAFSNVSSNCLLHRLHFLIFDIYRQKLVQGRSFILTPFQKISIKSHMSKLFFDRLTRRSSQ